MTDKTLWLTFDWDDEWTEGELKAATQALQDAAPVDTQVVITPDTIDMMDSDEREDFVEQLVDALESDS